MLDDDDEAASPQSLAELIGRPWPSNPPILCSDRIMQLAERGLTRPASLSLLEIRDLAASVIDHMARQERSSTDQRQKGASVPQVLPLPTAD